MPSPPHRTRTPYTHSPLDRKAVLYPLRSRAGTRPLLPCAGVNVFGTGEADVLDMILPVLGVNVAGSAVKIPILPFDPKGGFHQFQRL